MATELSASLSRGDLAVTLTPGGSGVLELYLDGEKLLDRKAEGGKYPDLERMREIGKQVKEKVEAQG